MPDRFAIVTGASTGIGLELAICCAQAGFDLLSQPTNRRSKMLPQT